jgi:hypothetical protein
MPNPYPGPRPFTADEHHIFAGRDHEVSELASLVVSHQVVLLYSQSGAGKTSLVNAGLKISLAERGVQVLPNARVGIPVPEGLPLGEVENVYTYSATGGFFAEIAGGDNWRLKATLAQAFERLPQQKDEFGESGLRLFILDQMEEIFGVYPQRWQDREAFFEQLAELLGRYRELRVLLVLREDYLAAFTEFARLLPEGARTRYRLDRLRESEAIAAVRKPLAGTRISFDTDVVETMIRDLMTITVVDPAGELVTALGEFVEPVQLQVVCFTLFERMPEASGLITMDAYRKFGDPDRALESFYASAVAAAVSATGIEEGELRDWCESRLITPAGTRGLVFQGRGNTGGISNLVVEFLEERHLIRPEIRSGSRWFELTHDRFIRPIQNSNLAWKTERWSKSFEVLYAEAIKGAIIKTGASEEKLRAFLDSLVDQSGGRISREAEGVPGDALGMLVGAGLLRREGDGDRHRFSLVDDGIAEAIRLANQSWRGENWAEARTLRELQDRADRWVAQGSPKTDMALTRAELRDAYKLLQVARVAGVGFRDTLDAFVDIGLRQELRRKLTWTRIAGVLFAVIAITSLLIPSNASIRLKIFSCSITGLGAAIGLGAGHENDGVVFMSLREFILLMLASAALGLAFAASSHFYAIWIIVPLGLPLGFLGCAAMFGVIFGRGEGVEKRLRASKH